MGKKSVVTVLLFIPWIYGMIKSENFKMSAVWNCISYIFIWVLFKIITYFVQFCHSLYITVIVSNSRSVIEPIKKIKYKNNKKKKKINTPSHISVCAECFYF